MALDRRSVTRYTISRPMQVYVGENQPEKYDPVKLVDLNLECARITSDKTLTTANGGIMLSITFPSTNENMLRLPAKLEEVRTFTDENHYILRFVSLDEKQKTGLEDCLKTLAAISDRRFKESPAMSMSITRTSDYYEKRVTKPVFLKCIRYNRMEKLMDRSRYYYMREIESGNETYLTVKGRRMLNFGSNNYLGMATNPEVKEAAIKAIEKYGVGSGGVRVLSGTVDLHNMLEKKLARFKGGEDCIVFSTGYTTNVGTVSALLSKNDYAIVDAKAHASLIDGCILSGSHLQVFKHNDMQDLEKELGKIDAKAPKMIITDGVFSMDGDVAKLDIIYELGKKYNAAVMVDDAHSTGVLGKTGRGTAEHFGLEGKIDVAMGTLSKALGAVGGFIVSKSKVIHYLKHNSRAFVFTTSLPPSVSASLLKVIEILETQPQWHERLWRNIRVVMRELYIAGFNTGQSESAVIPIILRDDHKTYEMTGMLEEEGVFVSPVVYPAVRRKEGRLRLSIMATHTDQDIQMLMDKLKKTAKKLNLISDK
ncbi:MAG: aminotransferase class I/II-fold pyridoxal phosphate-dependent enzyme [Elusimicrobiota bacterium]